MSHFSVLVRLPASVPETGIKDAVAELILPYKESGCGDSDPPDLERFLVFKDVEDEHLAKYRTETCPMVRERDGGEFSAYDDRYRSVLDGPRYVYPPGSTQFDKPADQVYPTFEAYMKDRVGYSNRDPKKNRYGHWENPNAKWDYWRIGGRWRARLPVKVGAGALAEKSWEWSADGDQKDPADDPASADYCRIEDLDWELIDAKTNENLNEFWDQWQRLCAGEEFPPFEGPYNHALALGILECKAAKELTGDEWKAIPWDKPDAPPDLRRNRFDVLKQITREWLETRRDQFNGLSSWARLNGTDGWQEKGTMGWFASADDTPESNRKYAESMSSWIERGGQQDWLAMVDCHI